MRPTGSIGCTGLTGSTDIFIRESSYGRQYSGNTWKPEIPHIEPWIEENPSISGFSPKAMGITTVEQTKEKTGVIKLKRRRVPRIFRYLLWTLVIVLAWKLVSNAEIITITLFNLFTK